MSYLLETARLRLRPLVPTDLDFLAEMLGDEAVMQFYPAVLDRMGAAAWLDRQLARYARDGYGPWLVEERDSGRAVGQIGPIRQELGGDDGTSVEVAYLLHRAEWGRGYAIEAAMATRDWVFAQLGEPRVISLIRPENLRSRRVAERNGFHVWREVLHAGLRHDVWGMEREAWLAARARASDIPGRTSLPSSRVPPMSIAQSILPEFDHEMATTRKLIERTPIAQMAWKPHEKSMSLGQLVAHLATLPGWGVVTMAQTELDLNPPGGEGYKTPSFDSVEGLLAEFDKNVAGSRAAIAAAADGDFMVGWSLKNGGHTVFTLPRIAVLRSFVMNHVIHHRGQYSVYLRLNNVPLPSMYGPTADER